MVNKYNLVDELWVPVGGGRLASLKDVFTDYSLKELGGTPVQKMAILKILLAIAQRACTPFDDSQWASMESSGLGTRCVTYLEKNRDLFWLYGDKPFLQMPLLEQCVDKKNNRLQVAEIGKNYIPDLTSENDSILFQSQIGRYLTDAEKVVFIISVMNYSPGGKRVVKDVPALTNGYEGKSNSAKAAPSIGNYVGYLNSCLWGISILDTVWLNLFTAEDFARYPDWKEEDLIPPWEEMPRGENDPIAQRIKKGFMGTLCSMSRFILLKDNGIIYMEGIQYPSHKDGWREPFLTYNEKGQMKWVDTGKKAWRNLDSLLALVFSGDSSSSFYCPQISFFLKRARKARSVIGIWSGGLKVRATAGDQSVKQTDDYVESLVFLDSKMIGDDWFHALEREMAVMEKIGYITKMSVKNYYKELKDTKTKNDEKAESMYWECCEKEFQNLVDFCLDKDRIAEFRIFLANCSNLSFNRFCPNETARQMLAWAHCRPKIGRIISEGKEGAEIE
jgi:CRISPR system Cascade subunit CasA